MDGLLFLGAIFAIGFVVFRCIVEDNRPKIGVPIANVARTSLLQKQAAKTRNIPNNARDTIIKHRDRL